MDVAQLLLANHPSVSKLLSSEERLTMKAFQLGLTCFALVVVRGMEKCSPEFVERAENMQDEHPDWIACNDKIEELGPVDVDTDLALYCFFPDCCQRAIQRLYDIFPENCNVEEWEDSSEEDIKWTKEYYASTFKTLCGWDLQNLTNSLLSQR